MALISTEELLLWLPQATGNETLLEDALARAQGLAKGYCGHELEATTYAEYYSPENAQEVVHLRHWPIVSVTSVYEWQQSSATLLTATTDYLTDNDAGLLWRVDTTWSPGLQEVLVTYRAGYTETTCPEGLKQALTQLTGWVIGSRGDVGTTADSVDGVSRTKEPLRRGVPESIAQQLDSYCEVRL